MNSVSDVAQEVNRAFYVLGGISLVMIVGVTIAMILFVVKYNRKRARVATSKVHEHMPLEIAWTVLPTLLVIFMFFVGYKGFKLMRNPPADAEIVRVIAELTLVLVLASDASRIDLRRLVRDHSLPTRMLGIGLPLTMLLGTLVAAVMFGAMPLWEAAILAIILAPTDASLGQPVVSNPEVPVRIR